MNQIPTRLCLTLTVLIFWLPADDATAVVDAPVAPGGWIEVTSLDRNGKVMDPSQDNVSIIDHHGLPIPELRESDLAGGYTRFGPLPASTYRVQREVSSRDHLAHVVLFEDVAVVAGEVERVILDESTINHDDLKTRCKGWVTFETSPLQGVSVTLRDELGVLARAVTDAEGQYDMAVAKSGTLWLKATHALTDSAVAKEVEVRPEKRTWFPLHLRSQGSSQYQPPQDELAGGPQSAGDLDGDGADDLLITNHTVDRLDWYRRASLAVSGATGELLFDVPASRFRRSCQGVGGVGDVDEDGTPDFITTFREKPGALWPDDQGIQLRSGKDGRLLLERVLEPRSETSELDATARRIHDVDGDGLKDVALARRERIEDEPKLVSIELLSGATLEPIRRFDVDLFEYGWNDWCCPGDLDLDGIDDVVVQGRRKLSDSPSLLALSGSTLRPIAGWEDRMKGHGAWGFVPAGDLDGDGAGDLFLRRGTILRTREVAMTLLALSGRTGEVLAQHVRTLRKPHGVTLVPLPDVNNDGLADLLLGSHVGLLFLDDSCPASVHSGADLSVIYVLDKLSGHSMLFDHHRIHGCSLDDVNGDGIQDIAVGATNPYGASEGRVELFSGKDGQPLRAITKNSIRAR